MLQPVLQGRYPYEMAETDEIRWVLPSPGVELGSTVTCGVARRAAVLARGAHGGKCQRS